MTVIPSPSTYCTAAALYSCKCVEKWGNYGGNLIIFAMRFSDTSKFVQISFQFSNTVCFTFSEYTSSKLFGGIESWLTIVVNWVWVNIVKLKVKNCIVNIDWDREIERQHTTNKWVHAKNVINYWQLSIIDNYQ